MALPKIKSPTFELKVPSSGEDVVYRPFLVKEQKILLMALESEDQSEMMRAIKQIIINCCQTELDVDNLPMFDLEYIFMKLRARSVGEEIELKLSHTEGDCEYKHPHTVNLLDIEIHREEGHNPKIILDEEEGIGIILRYPTLALADKINEAAEKSQIEVITDMVVSCVDVIFDAEEVYPASESTEEEISSFLNDLSQEQFEKVTNFFSTTPKLKVSVDWTCPECGKEETAELEGMANFFG